MGYGKLRLKDCWFAWLFLIVLSASAVYGLTSEFFNLKGVLDDYGRNNDNVEPQAPMSGESGEEQAEEPRQPKLYSVLSVTDGDTIRIDYNGTNTPLRLIGIDTPETVDERTTVQCFGQEASDYLKAKLTGKQVSIESDPTQDDRDKYDRLLRYVYLDGEDVGLQIIANGYGHEYTYNIPHKKQSEYKTAEKNAETNNLGLWSPTTCAGDTTKSANPEPEPTPEPIPTPAPTPEPQTTECLIKGNISYKGEKIYHVPGQQYYDETIITPSKGERYFCTEAEAIAAGWRKSKV